MTTKKGRPRRFSFTDPSDPIGTELSHCLGFLDELAIRTVDQVQHLPLEAMDYASPPGFSIGRLVLHLVGADIKLLSTALGGAPEPPYTDQLSPGLLGNFATPSGPLEWASGVLQEHVVWRRTHLLDRCRVPGFLDQLVEHPACRTNRELLGHLVWHWSYHSGQIGLLAWQAGFDYEWTSTPRS